MKPKPLTPQQAINNFKLFLELSFTRNDFSTYVQAVRELADTCIKLGIEGDDNHPPKDIPA